MSLTPEQQRAVNELQDLIHKQDPESAHLAADEILLTLIDNDDVRDAFNAIYKWYA
jgi:hypothetical protein